MKAETEKKKPVTGKTTAAKPAPQTAEYPPHVVEMMNFHYDFQHHYVQENPLWAEEKKEWLDLMKRCQATVKIYANQDRIVDIDKRFNKPGYYPLSNHPTVTARKTAFGDDISVEERLKLADKYAPEGMIDGKVIEDVSNNRQATKYRLIYSEDPFRTPEGFKVRKLISTCAPNFMNSSPGDEKTYITEDGNLNVEAYTKAARELATMIVLAAKENGMSPLGIAEFGLGVYLNRFAGKPAEADKAREIMYKAFARAAEYFDQKIEWVLWNGLADSPDRKQRYKKQFGTDNLKFKVGNILDYEFAINNGSDRTIGGAMNHARPKTTEEQVAQNSMLIEIQTEFNPELYNNATLVDVNQFVKDIYYIPGSQYVSNSALAVNGMHRGSYDALVNDAPFLQLRSAAKITQNEQFSKIEFEDQVKAEMFAKILFSRYLIHRKSDENLPVNISERNGKYFLRLGVQHFNTCMGNPSAFAALEEKTAKIKTRLEKFVSENHLRNSPEDLSWWSKRSNSGPVKTITSGNKSYTLPVHAHEAFKILYQIDQKNLLNVHEKMEALDKIREFRELSPLLKQGMHRVVQEKDVKDEQPEESFTFCTQQ